MYEQIPKEARTWAMASHLSALSIYVGIPFGNLIGPFICLLVKGKESPFVDDQAKEALNFQLSMTIYAIIAGLLIFLLIGFLLLPVVLLAHIIFTIKGAITANDGKAYRYPLTFRFFS